MVRLILYLLAVVAIASGLTWLADRPGSLLVTWQGYEIETSVFRAVVIFAALFGAVFFLVSLLRQLWHGPALLGGILRRRRQQRGLEALSSGMIAIGAGDRATATRYAIQARKSLPNEPLTHLLRAQAAQLSGDKTTARRIFEAMLASPDTEQLGLRGLFLEATREGATEAARQFAERAVALNPKLAWAVDALFDLQCRQGDWTGALDTLTVVRRHHHVEKPSADRRRAVLLTAQAQAAEDNDPERALTLALEAHGLAPDLVPAAAIAGRLLASRGNTPRATRIIQKTWARSPHPDLATAYAYARPGDSPRDRLDRVRQLAALAPNALESGVAVATTAIEARAFDDARQALEPFSGSRLTQRVCTLMARIDGEQHGDKGRVREWLARAVNAPRDPAWTADGVVAEQWAPVSPVTGALDAFQWRVPVEEIDKGDGELLARQLEALVPLGGPETLDAEPTATLTPVADETGRTPPIIEAEETAAGSLPPSAPARQVASRPADLPKPVEPEDEKPATTTAPSASATALTSGSGEQRRPKADARPAEARIFISPRAPDDPGPETAEQGEPASLLKTIRATS